MPMLTCHVQGSVSAVRFDVDRHSVVPRQKLHQIHVAVLASPVQGSEARNKVLVLGKFRVIPVNKK